MRVFVEVEQAIGQVIKREAHIVESLGESFEHIV